MEKREKSIKELSYDQLYDVFKKGIIEMVTSQFNGQINVFPSVVFLGVKYKALKQVASTKNPIINDYDLQKQLQKNKHAEDSMNTIVIELGKYSIDYGDRLLNQMAKRTGVELVKKHIDILTENDPMGVMFYVHISECWTIISNQTDNIDKKIEEYLETHSSLEGFEGVKEALSFTFENKLGKHDHFQYDIIRSENSNYQMLGKCEEISVNSNRIEGIYSGLLNNNINFN